VVAKTEKNTTRFVLYLRVSTTKQGEDGNGIAAQERDLKIFLGHQENPEVVQRFVEVESGAKKERPQLEAALELCRRTGAHLLVQKVDRLSRDVEFIAKLVKDKKVTLRVANLPNADNFQIHLFAAISAQEREFIAERTKAAMAAAKEKGKRFGNPKIAELNKTRKYEARLFASEVGPIVVPLRQRGYTYQEIANTLNEMELKTPKGCFYQPSQVKRILDRTQTTS